MANLLTDEEKLLVRKIRDKISLCEERYTQLASGFLNEREQDILLSELAHTDTVKAHFCGGYEAAERRLIIFVPEYLELDESDSIGALRCAFYKDYELNHRDFLGALMGLGIEREAVGDILLNREGFYADVIAKKEMIPFLLENFVSAGRAKLKVSEIPLSALADFKPKTETVTDTVMSARIDAVASCGFGISRENASALVKSGKVYLNRRIADEPDIQVPDNSLVTAQGYGKFRVSITDRLSKKGRIFIKIEKYI